MTKIETYGINVIGLEFVEEAIKDKTVKLEAVQGILDMLNSMGYHHLVVEFDKDGATFSNPVRH